MRPCGVASGLPRYCQGSDRKEDGSAEAGRWPRWAWRSDGHGEAKRWAMRVAAVSDALRQRGRFPDRLRAPIL